MLPIFKKGDRVLTQNWFYKLNLKDIVVAKVDKRLIIKRIKKLSALEVFLEGDNKKESTDSRAFEEIEKNKITGIVIFISK